MRSPMMQNGLSIAIVTVLDRDCRTVSTRVSLLGCGDAEALAQAPDRVVLAERDEMQAAHARLCEGVASLFDGQLEGFFAGVGGVLDPLDRGRRDRDARYIGVHELERPRAGDQADRGQERRVIEQPDARPLGAERLELRGLVTDLQLQEARARARLLERALRAVGQRRSARVLDGADEEVRGGLELAAREVLAARQSGRRDDDLGPVEVEHPAGFLLVAGGDVVARQAGDVLDAVQRRADDVGLDREAVLVAADDLHDRLDAEHLQRDGDGKVGGVRMRGRVVGGVDGVHPGRVLLELGTHRVQAAAVDDRQLPRDHEAAPGQFALELGHALPVVSGLPAGGRLPVALADEVGPAGRVLEPVVDRRAHVVVLLAPVLRQRGHALGTLEALQPHAAHLGLDLAVAVRPYAPAGPVAQRLRAVHRAGHAGRVQHALPAHLAAPDGALDRLLDERQRLHAGTSARFFSIRSLARRTAVEASAA